MQHDPAGTPQAGEQGHQHAPKSGLRALMVGLSGRLLLLTILFVMLSEVFIFLPSIANFRQNWLLNRLQAAQIAALAAKAAPLGELPEMLRKELLMSAGVRGIAIKQAAQRRLILADNSPSEIDASYDLDTTALPMRVVDALAVFFHGDGRIIRVMGTPPMSDDEMVEIVLSETPLRHEMIRWGLSILWLSVLISLLTAGLVYLALNWLMVRPMRRITDHMVRFAANPEDQSTVIRPTKRSDEIGTAERELERMQSELRTTLRERSRLAALGLAVSKINHDLRNILSNAQLISDRLGSVNDPTVQRMTPKLIASLDRAIRLCADTLSYGRVTEPVPVKQQIELRPIVQEVGESLNLPRPGMVDWRIDIMPDLSVHADADQVHRILSNLCRNALQSLEAQPNGHVHEICVSARRMNGAVVIDVSDTGPGVPARARQHLFVPFQGASRPGGTGLGLAIVAELMKAHGGTVGLISPSTGGAIFRLEFPTADPHGKPQPERLH
jgi:signal transduction histidine kinase